MVSTWPKVRDRRHVVTQMELPHNHAAVHITGCRVCLSLSLLPEGSRDNTCVKCDQVHDLPSLVAKPKGKVERLKEHQGV